MNKPYTVEELTVAEIQRGLRDGESFFTADFIAIRNPNDTYNVIKHHTKNFDRNVAITQEEYFEYLKNSKTPIVVPLKVIFRQKYIADTRGTIGGITNENIN